jgi:hypothetical protein
MAAQSPEELPEERRMEIFRALAEAQDLYDFSPEQARKLVANRFAVTQEQLRLIEREGRERLWPPF